MSFTWTDDRLVAVLADVRFRAILVELNEAGAELTVSDLSARLASDRPSWNASRESTKIRLYHDDVPRLADLGFVSFDPDTGGVTLTEELDDLEGVLVKLDRIVETIRE